VSGTKHFTYKCEVTNMATYEDEILGAQPSVNSGKDFITQFADIGVVDFYQETLVGGKDFAIGAFGASTGGTK
jgi:hypothetical protein